MYEIIYPCLVWPHEEFLTLLTIESPYCLQVFSLFLFIGKIAKNAAIGKCFSSIRLEFLSRVPSNSPDAPHCLTPLNVTYHDLFSKKLFEF